MKNKVCELENITVHYEVRGKRSGHPIIMLHGFTLDRRMMVGCMEPILRRRKGWQRIYLDLPGMGKTPAKDWITGSDQMLKIILDFIDKVIPDQSFALAGESYGGYLARGVVYRAPERVDGLLLICPTIIDNHKLRTVPPSVTLVKDRPLRVWLTEDEIEFLESFAVVESPEIWARTRDEIYAGYLEHNNTWLKRFEKNRAYTFDVDKLPAPFEKPTLVLMGRQDAWVGYHDALAIIENYPHGTFAVLDRAGHNLQIEQEQLFNALVGEWLNRIEETLPSPS